MSDFADEVLSLVLSDVVVPNFVEVGPLLDSSAVVVFDFAEDVLSLVWSDVVVPNFVEVEPSPYVVLVNTEKGVSPET